MPITSSGAIAFTDIQTELGGSNPISLSEYYRGGAYTTNNNTNVPTSGAISLSNFYGAGKQYAVTISSNQRKVNLRSLAVAAGWNESQNLLITINSGVIIDSDTTGTAACTLSGSFPNGVFLVNNGYIVGMGGAGGNQDGAGYAGGIALSVSSAVSVTNNNTIAGGGGGGGAGSTWSWNGLPRSSPGSGGASGLAQASGGSGSQLNGNPSGGPDGNGMYSSGGASANWAYGGRASSPGGIGGAWGTAGDAGGTVDGVYNYTGYAGGAAGAAVSGNSYVTWLVTGNRYGGLV